MKKTLALVMLLIFGPIIHTADGHNATEVDFQDWLTSFEAWDVLARSLAELGDDPQTILERAGYLVRLDQSDKAATLLHASGPFAGQPVLEAQRRWLLGRLSRQMGKTAQALAMFTSARKTLEDDAFIALAASEPGLNTFFQIAWLALYWDGPVGEFTGDRVSLLRESLSAAALLWSEDHFWRAVEQTYFGSGVPEAARFEPLLIMDPGQVRSVLVRTLALWSMQRFDQAAEPLASIMQPEVSRFWTTFGAFLRNGCMPDAGTHESEFPKIEALWHMGEVEDIPCASWFVRNPADPQWAGYLDALAVLDLDQAGVRVQEDLGSALLSPEERESLTILQLALNLAGGDPVGPSVVLENGAALPLCLQLALVIGNRDKELLLDRPVHIREPLLLLASTGGVEMGRPEKMFWLRIAPDMLAQAVALRPLDRELAYLHWSRELMNGFDEETAKRMAFLFPGKPAEAGALLALARSRAEQGAWLQAWDYLQRADPHTVGTGHRVDYLLMKAELQLELGRENDGLETYRLLMEEHPHRCSSGQMLKLVRAAQRQEDWDLAENVLDRLWEIRQGLDPGTQAEILFRMAECAEHHGRIEEARHSFMGLAWSYSEQPWAEHALFRSALLYELEGKLETARRLLDVLIDRSGDEVLRAKATDLRQGLMLRVGRGSGNNGVTTAPF